MAAKPPRVLSIAGSDSSGGAGIQADIKTITRLGGFAMTAITAVTAQNSVGVQAVELMPPELVASQIRSCEDDIGTDAIKIGMVGNAAIIEAIDQALIDSDQDIKAIVVDPVLVATSGAALADEETRKALFRLIGIAAIVTPNLPELAALTGLPTSTQGEIETAAMKLSRAYGCHVLAKGGHGEGDTVTDTLFNSAGLVESWTDPRIDTVHTHGTGCTLASAIATLLGHGLSSRHAVTLARQFVREAIKNAPGFGSGHGPLGHQAVGKTP